MSVLIEGMEIPKKKNGAVLIIYPDGKCVFEDGAEHRAVELPPHGDLIDRDALLKYELPATLFPNGRRQNPDVWTHAIAIGNIQEAPTVIPASAEDINVPTKEERPLSQHLFYRS